MNLFSGVRRFARNAVGFGRVLANSENIYKPWDDFWFQDLPTGGTSSGIKVNETAATKLSVWNACVRLYSTCLAMLPAKVYEDLGDGRKRHAREHPVDRLIRRRPNSYQTPFEWKQEVAEALAQRGNYYGEKIRTRRGDVVEEVWGIHGDHVMADWLNRRSGRQRVYDVSSSHDGKARTLRERDVWHPRLASRDGGLTGASPIRLNAESIGLALAGQGYAGGFFSNGARVAGFIAPEADGKLTKEQSQALTATLNEENAGQRGFHAYKVFKKALKFHKVSIGPKEAELSYILSWSIADSARILGIPLWMLQHEEKDTSWGSGIEQMGIGFRVYTLQPAVNAIEESVEASFIDDERFPVELDMGALVRADMKSQYDAFSKAVNANNPWLTRNDIRRWLNLQPDESPEGDAFLKPENNIGGGDGAPVSVAAELMITELVAALRAQSQSNGTNGESHA